VVYKAYLLGARFDGYREFFNWKIWEQAFEEEKIDYHQYLEEKKQPFFWSHIIWDGKVQS